MCSLEDLLDAGVDNMACDLKMPLAEQMEGTQVASMAIGHVYTG